MTLKIDFEWVDAGDSVDKLSSATMATVSIEADGHSLTAHIDRETHSHSNQITVPLYPIAEWITSWWWPLFHEFGDWSPASDEDYRRRHDLAFAGSGFVYPHITFQPIGTFLEIRSAPDTRKFSSIEFLTRHTSTARVSDVQKEFSRLVNATVERLRARKVPDTLVEQDWGAIGSMSEDERAFSLAAGRFGLDPFDTTEADADAIIRLCDATEPRLQDDLFGLAEPSSAEELLAVINTFAERASKERSGSAWQALRSQPIPLSTEVLPWEAGYSLARWARREMDLDGEPVQFEGDRSVTTIRLESENRRLTGVVASTSPTCALRPASKTTERFAIARALGAYLMLEGAGPALLTSTRNDRQARTRSFAAEFLAPAEGIRRRLRAKGGWIDEEEIEELAQEFQVSSFVVAHQVTNHALGRSSFG